MSVNYEAHVNEVLRANAIRSEWGYFQRNDPSVAFEHRRIIITPRPVDPETTIVALHEIGHIVEPACTDYRDWVRETLAWAWAIDTYDARGLPEPGRARAEAASKLHSYLSPAARRDERERRLIGKVVPKCLLLSPEALGLRADGTVPDNGLARISDQELRDFLAGPAF